MLDNIRKNRERFLRRNAVSNRTSEKTKKKNKLTSLIWVGFQTFKFPKKCRICEVLELIDDFGTIHF